MSSQEDNKDWVQSAFLRIWALNVLKNSPYDVWWTDYSKEEFLSWGVTELEYEVYRSQGDE